MELSKYDSLCTILQLFAQLVVTDINYYFHSDLKLARNRLLDLVKNANNTSDMVEPAFVSYLALFYGLMWEIESFEEQSHHVGRPNPSKLRNLLVFKWTQTLLGPETQ